MTNIMRNPKITKIVLSAGATGKDLEKASMLLEMLSEMKSQIIKSGPKRRIPSFGVKPSMPLGTRVTIRGKKANDAEMAFERMINKVLAIEDEANLEKVLIEAVRSATSEVQRGY